MKLYRTISTHKFTLIELMVILTIISLLAGVLIPALTIAREKLTQIACLDNMKQQAYGIVEYTNDNKGYMPVSYTGAGDPGNSWWYYVSQYSSEPMAYFWDDIIAKLKTGIWACPSADVNDPNVGAAFITYKMNTNFRDASVTPFVSLKYNLILEPSEKLMVMDGRSHPVFSTWKTTPGIGVWYPHLSKANSILADGHIEAFDPDTLEVEWSSYYFIQ